MTSQNEEAEGLMRRVEKEEEQVEPDQQVRLGHSRCGIDRAAAAAAPIPATIAHRTTAAPRRPHRRRSSTCASSTS